MLDEPFISPNAAAEDRAAREGAAALARATKGAQPQLAASPAETRTRALQAMADAVVDDAASILEANALDCAAASALPSHLLDRLRLDHARLAAAAAGLSQLAELEDAVGAAECEWTTHRGLLIRQRRVPLGLIAAIFEARPNVAVDLAGLAIRTGNALLLRPGSEALRSVLALVASMRRGLTAAGVDPAVLAAVDTPGRAAAGELLHLRGLVDLLIPRGGPGLIAEVTRTATVPVIETGIGVCHVYVDRAADLGMAADITDNAKTSRPAVCNAAEALLVHRDVAGRFLPEMAARLRAKGVELRADPEALSLMPGARPAVDDDWGREFLDLVLAVKVVPSLDAALQHIARYGSGHSEAIVTGDEGAARRFLEAVDAACVYWNASTRFTDGYEFGYGAEAGISTQKLHVRGPMGPGSLLSSKFEIVGRGQVRE